MSEMRERIVMKMSALEKQIMQSLNGLSDDSLGFILDLIQRFVKPAETNSGSHTTDCKLGSMKGQKFIADCHEIDDYDDEIAQMSGVIAE